ncbi:hypothetical protein BCAR13_100050 [Paraburkholderia caribensis]|nr:hypothetical protein BCAR13_100050 [Paraburkholderia caribensis]
MKTDFSTRSMSSPLTVDFHRILPPPETGQCIYWDKETVRRVAADSGSCLRALQLLSDREEQRVLRKSVWRLHDL